MIHACINEHIEPLWCHFRKAKAGVKTGRQPLNGNPENFHLTTSLQIDLQETRKMGSSQSAQPESEIRQLKEERPQNPAATTQTNDDDEPDEW